MLSPKHPLSWFIAFLVPSLAIALTACGDSSSGSGGGGAGGTSAGGSTSTTPKEPKVHRASGATCPTDRPAGVTDGTTGDCTTDADCTNGMNGRCEQRIGAPPICSYDECQSDTDCGTAACECRNPAQFLANVCVHGNCITDADCNGDYCSPSAVTLSPFCTLEIPIGTIGYFCHSGADECVNDDECPAGTSGLQSCLFDADKGHWACRDVVCVN